MNFVIGVTRQEVDAVLSHTIYHFPVAAASTMCSSMHAHHHHRHHHHRCLLQDSASHSSADVAALRRQLELARDQKSMMGTKQKREYEVLIARLQEEMRMKEEEHGDAVKRLKRELQVRMMTKWLK